MAQPSFDPGLTRQYGGKLGRSIDARGRFNVLRSGFGLRDTGVYLFLMNRSWFTFFAIVGAAYLVVNLLFALVYYAIGVDTLQGAHAAEPLRGFLDAFFFSVQTFTTVGYGHMAPNTPLSSFVAAMEALSGLLGFAVGTGLLWGRFSKPSACLVFSDRILVAPYQGGLSLQFRVANRRPNVLMEIEAKMLMMTVEGEGAALRRDFVDLKLEVPSVYFLPLTWTLVHKIDETSPFWGMTAQDLAGRQLQMLILLKAFDDTFSQTVHGRFSYTHEEFVWNARFVRSFDVNDQGALVLHMSRVSQYEVLA